MVLKISWIKNIRAKVLLNFDRFARCLIFGLEWFSNVVLKNCYDQNYKGEALFNFDSFAWCLIFGFR